MHPAQQQGLRLPFCRSAQARLTWSFLVSAFLGEVTQQIHSFRASGVMSRQVAWALGESEQSLPQVGRECVYSAGGEGWGHMGST